MGQILQRLDRVEDKLENIGVALVQLAKTEERVSLLLQQTTDLFSKNNDLQKRLSRLEIRDASQAKSIGFFERLGWLVLTGLVGLVGYIFKD